MKKLIIALLAIFATVALAAAGDKFITNTNIDKDVIIEVNDGGVNTQSLIVTGATGAVSIKGSDGTDSDVVGRVGETICATGTGGVTTVSADTEVDATGMSVPLTAGKWLVRYDISALLIRVGTTGNVRGRFRITDSGNTPVAGSDGYFRTAQIAAADAVIANVSRSVLVSPTATTTYKVRATATEANTSQTVSIQGSSTDSSLTNPDNASNICATRIR